MLDRGNYWFVIFPVSNVVNGTILIRWRHVWSNAREARTSVIGNDSWLDKKKKRREKKEKRSHFARCVAVKIRNTVPASASIVRVNFKRRCMRVIASIFVKQITKKKKDRVNLSDRWNVESERSRLKLNTDPPKISFDSRCNNFSFLFSFPFAIVIHF